MTRHGSIDNQLMDALRQGLSAEQATAEVLEPYDKALAGAGLPELIPFVLPAVLRHARAIARCRITRPREDSAFGGGSKSKGRMILARLEFHLPDGTPIAWEDSTAEDHRILIAWMEASMAAQMVTLRRHKRTLKLLEETGAARLGNIPGWEDLIGDEAGDASGNMVP